jgi:hypothetical protein
MQRLPFFYKAYFRRLARGKKLTGDITPGYCQLSSAQLGSIFSRLERFGFDTKLIFMMRDPVNRCHSMAKMWKKRFFKNKQINDIDLLRLIYNHPRCEVRTKYDDTLRKIDDVTSGNALFLFNEKLNQSVAEVNKFLEVELPGNAFDTRKFTNAGNSHLPLDLQQKIIFHYEKTYRYCFQRFPVTKSLWQDAYQLLN